MALTNHHSEPKDQARYSQLFKEQEATEAPVTEPTATEGEAAQSNETPTAETATVQETEAPKEPSHVKPLPASEHLKSPKPEAPWYKKTGAKVAAGALAVFAAFGIGSQLGGDDNTIEAGPSAVEAPVAETPNTTTETVGESSATTLLEGNQPTESLPDNLELPTSDNPQILANQLYSNLEEAVNTNDPTYVEFRYADMDISGAQEVIQNMREAANYREKVEPAYSNSFDVTVLSSHGFESNGPQRIITVDVQETEILDSEGNTREYRYIHELTLVPVKRFITSETGETTDVTLWLIKYLDHHGDVLKP